MAKMVSLITVRHECLIDFEQYIPYVKCSLLYLKLGYIKSLTFGFRVIGFDYATSDAYNSDYRKYKGDIVAKFVVTYSDGCYFIKLIED